MPTSTEEKQEFVRITYKPHWGTILLAMGVISIPLSFPFFLCSVIYASTNPPPDFFLFLISLALPGLFLGLSTWLMARHDLAKMGKGLINPAGKALTRQAELLAIWGINLCLLGLAFWAICFSWWGPP